VAFDRASRSRPGEKRYSAHLRKVADTIHREICAKGVDPERGCFVQAYGSTKLDASLLLLPLVGFLPAHDKRIRSTVHEIENRLVRKGLVMRYETETGVDGLPPGEGAFLACSFWLADNYGLMGRHKDAVRLYNRLRRLANDVGLFAEEYDPDAKRQLGNFPQAFSHVALINSALNLMIQEESRHNGRKKKKAKRILRH
jgi:GH15 family glucan-1,4-alpha-glucosidase